MPRIKLHVKTTLLASVITIGMLITALIVTSAGIANLERDDDKALAGIQAIDLARHISDVSSLHDPAALETAANLTKGSRPNIVSVRIWDRTADGFAEKIAATGSLPAEPVGADVRDTLLRGLASKAVDLNTSGSDQLYRVFATIFEGGKPTGAVEIVERFDSIWSIAFRYVKSVVWMSLVTVVLIMLGTYLLFRHLVYQPIDELLGAMSRAKAGDLEARVPVHSNDELGLLSQEFNSMLGQVRDMTKEREAQRDLLRQRVQEATCELEFRNQQLQETNLELWRTNRRMNELGRLAAAGQTAAHFAHEVGTPLNLISGHVQLLKADLERDPHDAEARIRTISAQIERIERIVRRMLDKTRFETELSPLDLNGLLRKLCDAMSPALDKRGIKMVFDLEEKVPLIAGSADRLQQLFLNLINNSLDAMPEGGELTVRTGIAGSKNGKSNQVVVDFADTGLGMTPEIMSRIFDPLYTTKARGHGTGLGLVIVNQVVVEHGGTVEVESEPGRGTRFRLVFSAIQNDRFSKDRQMATAAVSDTL
ncbi:MAG TPA: ATP-binding protein [Pyrinomonadaceae bacterium]|jgi:signal transduction histidine kinase|nr:ATP-binding protein [Pyrinomonadaceae bacterium]